MGFVTMPPIDQGSPQLWMHVSDVFHISGRGSVVTGQLEGSGYLNVGDTMTCADRSWQVGGIEQFRKMLTTAAPGANIGVLLKGGAADVVRGMVVQFAPSSATGSPQFDPRIVGPQFDPSIVGPQFTVLPPKRKRWRR